MCRLCHQSGGVLYQRPQVKIDHFQRQPSGFNLGEIENIIYDSQECLAVERIWTGPKASSPSLLRGTPLFLLLLLIALAFVAFAGWWPVRTAGGLH